MTLSRSAKIAIAVTIPVTILLIMPILLLTFLRRRKKTSARTHTEPLPQWREPLPQWREPPPQWPQQLPCWTEPLPPTPRLINPNLDHISPSGGVWTEPLRPAFLPYNAAVRGRGGWDVPLEAVARRHSDPGEPREVAGAGTDEVGFMGGKERNRRIREEMKGDAMDAGAR